MNTKYKADQIINCEVLIKINLYNSFFIKPSFTSPVINHEYFLNVSFFIMSSTFTCYI